MQTTQVKWLVENFESNNKIWKLIDELKSRKQTVEVVDYYNYTLNNNICESTPTKCSFDDNDCVIVQGSIQLALWVKNNKPWVPAVWLDIDKFKCTTVYSHLGEFLFNQDYEFSTIGEFNQQFEHYFDKYGIQDCLFVRPNTGLKSFSGQICQKENHITDSDYFNMCTNDTDIIIISSPKVIEGEWRFIVGDGKIVTSSMYRHKGERKELPGAPTEAYELVEKIIAVADKELKVAPMYAVDVCENANGKFSLMEINCFTCAGMYECDKKATVDVANELAVKEWIKNKELELSSEVDLF